MTSLQELIEAVHASGVTIRVEGSDLKIRPAGLLPPELKIRLREHKPDLLLLLQPKHANETPYTDAELSESMRRLEAARVSIAVLESGEMRVVQTETELAQAIEAYVVYSPRDMYYYIQLQPQERRMLHGFKKRFGAAAAEWNAK